MKTPNRDLLVLVKDNHLNQDAIQFELDQLNQLLMVFETLDNLCLAHEVFDLKRYKIHTKLKPIKQVIAQKELKPFTFLINKN